MGKRNTRYKKMESMITVILCLDAIIFLGFLILSGIGMTALKAITAILSIALSGFVLYILFITKELLRKRSLWMTLAAVCILLCLFASLILHFPAPRFTL